VIGARLQGEPLEFPLAQTGAHWGPNSLATLLALLAMDVTQDQALAALAEFAPLAGRGAAQAVAIDGGQIVLIDESYNANPLSMAAALNTLGAHPTRGRRLAVLTDMLELGEDAPRQHAALAAPIDAAEVDLVFCAGPLMAALWDALPTHRRGGYAPKAESLAQVLMKAVRPDDVVMIKGSNGSKASRLVAALQSVAEGAPG
jgi:UDP-N-acetylmuramoyl-tripeptide--D-alanyl-D-alanine ligase